ncbi:MAG: IS66 family transposase [Myxococcales bacterium]|nr:IS66 family transposase [Myxococcales bacterium]
MSPASSTSTKRQTPKVALDVWDNVRPLLDSGNVDDARDLVVGALSALAVRNAELELLLKKARDAGRGATSEKVTPEQLSLLAALLADATPEDAEPSVEAEMCADAALDQEIVDATAQAEAAAAAGATGESARKKTRNRALRLDSLRVEETVLPIPEDKADWRLLGYDETQRIRFSPAHFYRELIKSPVLEAPELDDDGNTRIVKCTDQVPPTLQPGCVAGNDVIAAVLTMKYERHMPLHRMRRAFLADQGLDLPVSTLCDWAALGGKACERLAKELRDDVLASWLTMTDATGLRVNDPKSGVYRGTIWCVIGRAEDPDKPPNVLFEFTENGEGETGPWTMFEGRTGYVMADANNVYDRIYNGRRGHAIEVGCNAHAVRDVKGLLPADPRGAYIVQLIRRAYRLETLADAKCMSHEQRAELRQQRTRPLFEDKLKPYLAQLIAQSIPSDPLRKAAQYYINHWTALTRFLDDGRLPLDNNAVESALRVVRLGENNYLFAGSTEAAKRLAAILTVIATARAHGHNIADYLTRAFDGIATRDWDASVRDLLPAALKA